MSLLYENHLKAHRICNTVVPNSLHRDTCTGGQGGGDVLVSMNVQNLFFMLDWF